MTTLDTMTSPFSRRTLLKGAGAAGAGLTLAQIGLLRAVAQETESVQDIIDIAATAESLAVTLLGGAIDSAGQGNYNTPIPDAVIAILEAARAEEQYHLDYLQSAGAKPLTQSFTVPDTAILSNYDALFGLIVQLEGAFIAAYGAAMRQFAILNQPGLVKVAYQVGTVEAEHRVLANYALGVRPANNLAFEANLFDTVGDAATALTNLGFIGGDGAPVDYPGPGDIQFDLVSESEPGGPVVDCTPVMTQMPNTGSGTGFRPSGKSTGFDPMASMLGLFGVGAAALGVHMRRLNKTGNQPSEDS